ncbi:MAG: peptidoglycan-binding protein [Coriobacteriia bacterium]|nr:peptidoglycan-binding protein [Coriobacteriia bacterium]
MKPIKHTDSGAAVEDIQRRLRILGYKIGSEDSSGVFLDDTLAAVTAFQRAHGIEPTGSVGPRTWSTLVDSTFELGDRMLYLRMPYFHGADVVQLQRALDSLGFVTGGADGIFGANTERAVTEFQQNYDINSDGLVGNNTLRALLGLRHIWGGKEGAAHSSAQGSPRKQYRALLDYYFDFQADLQTDSSNDNPSVQAALRRIVRYANNLEEAARAEVMKNGTSSALQTTILVHVRANNGSEGASLSSESIADELNFAYQDDSGKFTAILRDGLVDVKQKMEKEKTLKSATQSQSPVCELHVVIPRNLLQSGSQTSLPPQLQIRAARLLDALCLAMST